MMNWLKNIIIYMDSLIKKSTFSSEWKSWIIENVQRGCSKDEIFKLLFENGFSFSAIQREMNYSPSLPLNMIKSVIFKAQSKYYIKDNKETKLLTIVMAFLNEGDEPKRTIESIYQTAPKHLFQIIAIDDCSDDSNEKFDEFPEVSFIKNKKRIGLQASKHMGAKLSDTPFILFIDAHMRFRDDNWCLEFINALRKEPETVFCSVCLGLNDANMDVNNPNGKGYGATIEFAQNKSQAVRDVIKAQWIEKNKHGDNEIPCLLGACYGYSRNFYFKTKGFYGLQMWGTTEPYISLKTWLLGGKCKILPNVAVGHKFREKFPYKINSEFLHYNKIYLCKVILPSPLSDALIDFLPKTKSFIKALKMIEIKQGEINDHRRYYEKLNTLNFEDYCKKFDIKLPIKLNNHPITTINSSVITSQIDNCI